MLHTEVLLCCLSSNALPLLHRVRRLTALQKEAAQLVADLRSKIITVPSAGSMKRRSAQLGGRPAAKQRKTVHFKH